MSGNRKTTRLKHYDYSQEGAYYVTVCVNGYKCVFGDVQNDKMVLNSAGKAVRFIWLDLSQHNTNIELDEFIVMPNHIHGIIKIVGAGSKPALNMSRAGLEPAPTKYGLFEIVRQFKTFSAKRVNAIRNCPGIRLWQRNYYEHIIRSESELTRIREYIINNPTQWRNDKYY